MVVHINMDSTPLLYRSNVAAGGRNGAPLKVKKVKLSL
jgi:hypothetical protein